MKTNEFAGALKAFSELATAPQAAELRAAASFFEAGKVETLAARVKKLQPAYGAPALLKDALQAILSGFKFSGATKQATAMTPVIQFLSVGADLLTIDEFISRITAPPPLPVSRKKTKPPEVADQVLAEALADDLKQSILDKLEFGEVVKRLKIAKQVNTPTLALTARLFLGNEKQYDGRKDAIDDILKRQRADAREHARGQALKRIGV